MKFVKLIAIVAVVAALIFGILNIQKLTGGSIKASPEQAKVFENVKRQIDNDWDNRDHWSLEAYRNTRSKIKVSRQALQKAQSGSDKVLLNRLNTKAMLLWAKDINDEFAKTNCSPATVGRLKKEMDEFLSSNGTITSSETRISEAYGIISLYNNVMAFGKSSFALSPGFSSSTNSWNNFDAHSQAQRDKANSFRGNRYYDKISHITDVKNSLSSVDSRLSTARSKFASDLSAQIINAYRGRERNPENHSRLADAVAKYYDHYSDGGNLRSFYNGYVVVDIDDNW